VIATDLEGGILSTNPAAERLFGWSASEVLGHAVDAVTVPSAPMDQAVAILDLIRGGKTLTGQALVIHRTSLYYRLRRVREISGADLASGDDRLALHLGIEVARFIGLR
jgi:PAS domain S-box-containing protein